MSKIIIKNIYSNNSSNNIKKEYQIDDILGKAKTQDNERDEKDHLRSHVYNDVTEAKKKKRELLDSLNIINSKIAESEKIFGKKVKEKPSDDLALEI